MHIAINIDGQFQPMTGIQHYVDSLLGALYASDTPHVISAFVPLLFSLEPFEEFGRDGLFSWRRHPRFRVDPAGSTIRLATHPFVTGKPWLLPAAHRLDGGALLLAKKYTTSLRARFASRKFDVLHLPNPIPLRFERLQARRKVATLYDLTTITQRETHEANNVGGWERFFRYAQRRCDRVLTISEFSKQDIVEHLGIPADRVDVTPLAARVGTQRVEDSPRRRELLQTLGLENTPFVLYSGTLEPRKNLSRLIQAFAQTVREGRLDEYKLVLAGGHWPPHDEELQKTAVDEKIAERVVMTGYVSNEQMNALMSACQAFAYVSRYEGFGLPPLEAMVCGAPVISSNTTSLPEVVGEAALCVSPDDTEGIAAALHRLLTDASENARRRERSLARAALFSWEHTAALTLASYEAALAA